MTSNKALRSYSSKENRQRILFVVTTPFAVNAFLTPHLVSLAKHYQIYLCVNISAYELSPRLDGVVNVLHISFKRNISLLNDFINLIQLMKTIHQVRPVAVHSITPKAGLLAMIASYICGVQNRLHTFTGQVWETRNSFARVILKNIDRLIVACSTKVFADSPSQCLFLQAEKIVSDDSICVLGEGSIAGVDTQRFHSNAYWRKKLRIEMGCSDATCVFIFVGRLTREKGILDLIEAFDEVKSFKPDTELWVVGPDEEDIFSCINFERNCINSIRWMGPTHTPELFMMAADVLVLPSYREGFGSVIIEAAACGLPCVAYRINGVIDAVADNESGILVAVGSVDALAEALILLLENKLLRKTLGDNAMKRTFRLFREEVIVAAWLKYYRFMLENQVIS